MADVKAFAKATKTALVPKGKAAASAPKAAVAHNSEADELVEKELKDFDMRSLYGPCTGMTRMERYQRAVANAHALGQAPPVRVLQLLQAGASNVSWADKLVFHKADAKA